MITTCIATRIWSLEMWPSTRNRLSAIASPSRQMQHSLGLAILRVYTECDTDAPVPSWYCRVSFLWSSTLAMSKGALVLCSAGWWFASVCLNQSSFPCAIFDTRSNPGYMLSGYIYAFGLITGPLDDLICNASCWHKKSGGRVLVAITNRASPVYLINYYSA